MTRLMGAARMARRIETPFTSYRELTAPIVEQLRDMRLGATALALEGVADVLDYGSVEKAYRAELGSRIDVLRDLIANPEEVQAGIEGRRDGCMLLVSAFLNSFTAYAERRANFEEGAREFIRKEGGLVVFVEKLFEQNFNLPEGPR